MNRAYSKSVFINCPFSESYQPLFRAMMFTVVYCGYIPRCALEFDDSNHVRLQKIEKLIEQSKFGIHDLSFMDLDKNTDLPRFNMPFELGLFLGAKRYGDKWQKKKRYIVLDKERYRYQKAISDLAGQDIKTHDNNPKKIIKSVRDWLKNVSRRTTIPGARKISNQYQNYEKDLPEICKRLEYDFEGLTYNDLWETMTFWLKENIR